MDYSVIQHIQAKKSIVAYLEEKGYQPVKILTGGRMAYLCPFPDHKETKPSFYVWTNSEFENFHCFGCQRHHSIIDLVAGLENISFRQALDRLAADFEITIEESVGLDLKRIRNIAVSGRFTKEISDVLLSVGSLCRSYMESVGGDASEQCIIDSLYRQIDLDIANFEFDKIEETLQHLPVVLSMRQEKYDRLKFEELEKQYASGSNDKS